MMKIFSFVFSVAIAGMLLSGCTAVKTSRGNAVEDFRLEQIYPNVSTKTNVLKTLGSPTTKAPFDDNVWYYMGQKMEKHGVFDPKVVDEKIVVVEFDENGVVRRIEKVDAQRMDIPKSKDKTPTGGNEMTVMEQFIGNLGRFNSPSGDKAGR